MVGDDDALTGEEGGSGAGFFDKPAQLVAQDGAFRFRVELHHVGAAQAADFDGQKKFAVPDGGDQNFGQCGVAVAGQDGLHKELSQ